jgi:hypothetical protein
MAFLYINNKGIPWRKHSYSAGNDADQCMFKYYLRRVLGWKPRDDRAAFAFGRALEESVQSFHDNNGCGAVEDFIQRWAVHKDANLKYSKIEGGWEQLNRAGQEMLQLYAIRQPSLPIPLGAGSIFQREYEKEMFPGDPNYGEILDAGKIDIISYVDPNHPMLPPMDWPAERGPLRPALYDMKTSCLDFPDIPGIAAFDKQIRRYSFLSGIETGGLIWFKKCGHGIQKGTSVTLLKNVLTGKWTGGIDIKAGDEAVVAYIQTPIKPTKKEPDKQPPLSLGVYLVQSDYFIRQMDEVQGRREDGDLDTTNEAKERKYAWLRENAVRVDATEVTRQRLQFNVGIISKQSAEEAGMIAARQIVQIVNAWKTQTWINNFGVRFPCNDITDPYFRAFVLKDEAFKKENFTRSDDDSIDELFTEEEPEEV